MIRIDDASDILEAVEENIKRVFSIHGIRYDGVTIKELSIGGANMRLAIELNLLGSLHRNEWLCLSYKSKNHLFSHIVAWLNLVTKPDITTVVFEFNWP